jgi:hypothetical protein
LRGYDAHAAEFPAPPRRNLEWRAAFACDLDRFPARTYNQGRLRLAQRAGIVQWPAAALVAENDDVLMIVNAIPVAGEQGGVDRVDMWAVVAPDLATRAIAVGRACRRLFARLTRAATGKPICIWIEEGNVTATSFAAWLGFEPVGKLFVAPVCNVKSREWRWTT